MKSNFEFLNLYWPTLSKIGSMAENYLYDDPNTCIYKLGMFAERLYKKYSNLNTFPNPTMTIPIQTE